MKGSRGFLGETNLLINLNHSNLVTAVESNYTMIFKKNLIL